MKQAGEEIRADHFAYPFYLSSVFDLDPAQQAAVDQRSIRIPLSSPRCYAGYDCTGQQMRNSAIVLINDGCVSLDLQKAEEINAR